MNPFDEALDDVIEQSPAPTAGQAPPDPFDAALDSVLSEDTAARTARIKVAGSQADTLTPDRAADVYRLSRRYGLSPAIIEKDFDRIQRRAKQDDTPYARMLAETPALAEYLSEPFQAAAVKDDIEPLAVLEKAVRVAENSMRALVSGVPRLNASLWGVLESAAETAGQPQLAAVAKTYRLAGMADADYAKGAQAGSGELEKAFYSGFESVGLMVPGALMSIMTGTPGPMLATMGAATGGEAYGRARDEGLSVGRANLFGVSQAAVEIATEMIPARLFVKDLAKNAGFRKMVVHQLGSEVPGEQLATALQDLDEWATFNPEAPFSEYIYARPDAFVQTLVSTITSVGAMTTVASAAQRLAGENGRAERAEGSKAFFDEVAQAVGSMKTAEKFPESIETVIANATAGGSIEKLYMPVDTFTTYFQGVGEDPADQAAQLTGDVDAYARALKTGEDLAIPTATYAARLSRSEHNAYFVQELRLGPDEMNIREAAEFKEQQAAAATFEAEETAAPEVSPTAPIRAALLGQLETAGVEKGTASAYVDLYESVFANLGERTGVDPVQLFEQYGLKVERPDLAPPIAPMPTKLPEPVAVAEADRQKAADLAERYAPYLDVLEAFPAIDVAAQGPREVAIAYFTAISPEGAIGVPAVIDDLITATSKIATSKGEQKVAILDWIRTNEATRQKAGAATAEGAGVAVAREPNIIDAPVKETGVVDESGRALGGYAGAERRTGAVAGPPGGVERRNEPAGLQPNFRRGDVGAAAARYRAENPAIEKEADAMRARALAGKVLDKNANAEDTTGEEDASTEQAESRVADQGRSPTANRIAASDPGRGKTGKRAAQHFARVFGVVLDSAREIDPAVDEVRLREEFDFRVAFLLDQQHLAANEGHSPHELLREIAKLGGLYEADNGMGLHAELKALGAGAPFGALAGIRGVFAAKKVARTQNQKSRGHGVDVMLQMLQSDPRFAWIESTEMLLDAIDEVSRHGVDKYEVMLPGTEELRDAGIRREKRWWPDGWAAGSMLEDVDESVIAGAEGDTSFDVTEFNQSLFDEFDALEDPAGVDTLATGEKQPRLPEAGQVREQEVATPEVAEVPFSLTAPTAKAKKTKALKAVSADYQTALEASRASSTAFAEATRRYRAQEIGDAEYLAARQANDEATKAFDAAFAAEEERQSSGRTLFQGEAGVTPESLREWVAGVRAKAGADLVEFDVVMDPAGEYLYLDVLAVARGAQRAGLGSKVMKELTRYADANGLPLALSPAAGTIGPGAAEAQARLVKFYKKFGFVENEGRHLDTSIPHGMYREPTLPRTLDQALFHGSPHNFEKFSLEHIGTGEGAAAYGWGLYFAENPEIAVGYHRQLAIDPTIELMKLGSMRLGASNSFDYSRRAGESDIENIRASLAEDLLIDEVGMRAAVATGKIREHVLGVLDDKIKGYTDEWAEGVGAAQKLRAELAKPGAIDVKLGGTEGGVYQVDIADEHIPKMLDWDAPIDKQPEPVKQLVRDALKTLKYLGKNDDGPRQLKTAFRAWVIDHGSMTDGPTGQSAYQMLSQASIESDPNKIEFDKLHAQMNQARAQFGPGGDVAISAEDRARYRELDTLRQKAHADGPKLASKQLLEAGVPGLRYLDAASREEGARKKTRNVVVFDDSIITLTHKDGSPVTPKERREYFQGDKSIGDVKDKRGVIRFGDDRQMTIGLLERADLSTFLHESGHLFLEVFGDIVDKLEAQGAASMAQGGAGVALTEKQNQAVVDYKALLAWLGVANRAEITDAHHEQFARGFEAYLMEGKAPSPALRASFARFRSWLVGIYRSLRGLKVNLSDDVRRVLDRMVASDQAIAQAEQDNQVAPIFTTAEAAGMGPAEFELYRQTIEAASTAARETLELQTLTELQRERTAEWKAQRAEIHDAVEAETHAMPVYVAISAMQFGKTPAGESMVEGLETPPVKLSRKILVDRFGAARLRRLPRPYIYSKEGGIDPEAAATIFGFTSADELLNAVEAAEPMARRIERETDRRMLERHGSMLLDGSLQEKAVAAIGNEQREAIVRAEIRALGNLRRQARPFVQAGADAIAAERREREYERRWFEAEARLRIAIAAGRKQVEIDALKNEVAELKAKARGGAATINAAIPSTDTILQAARERIARTKVREIKPQVFWSAARRAARKAIDSAARQDFEAAIIAKQQELINLALFREATRVKAETDARIQRALDLGRPAARARLGKAGGSYLEQVDALLDRYDFSRQSGKVLDRRESLRVWVQALQAQGMPVEIPDDVLDDTRRIHYTELTVEELEGVSDALDHIVHLARLKNKLLKIVQAGELKQTAESLAASIREHFTGTARDVIETHLPGESNKRTIAGFFASHRKLASFARQLDGFEDGGPLWEALSRPVNEAADKEAEMNAAATKALSEIVKTAFPGREKVKLYQKEHIPAIGRSMTKMGRIMVALNWGNEGNRQRIRDGYQWNDAQVVAILDTLDERDWKFVQGTWDFIGSYWEQIEAKQQRVTGVAPARVESIPVQTKFGLFNGGYFPLKYNERLEAQAGANLDLEAGNLQKQAAYVNATTKRGHTKDRVKNVKMRVRLDFGVLFEHVTQVIHDLSHHEMLIDVGRVIGHPSVQKAIYETHGEIVYREIKDGLRDIAFGVVPAVKFHEKAINHLRVGATIAGLGWNLTTAMLQPVGLTQSMVRIGPKWVGRGLYRWLRDAGTMENTVAWISERSSFMRLRGQTQQREINEIRNQVGVNTGKLSGWVDEVLDKTTFDTVSRQGVADSFFFLIQQMQRVADVPTWLGAYEKAMGQGETEDRAVALADQAVLDAQGGGQVKDLAGVQRGGPMLRLWTNFYSFFNTTYNLTVESTKRTNFKKPGSVARLAVDYLLLYSVPAAIGYTIRQALKPGDDDDDSIAEALIREQLAYMAGTVLLLRETQGTIQGYQGYEGPAGARGFAAIGRFLKQAEQVATSDDPLDELDAAFWRSLNDSAGILFHYPSGQTRRTIEGVRAIAEGETSNPGAILVGAPKK